MLDQSAFGHLKKESSDLSHINPKNLKKHIWLTLLYVFESHRQLRFASHRSVTDTCARAVYTGRRCVVLSEVLSLNVTRNV
jgi:hypothetical protein